MINNLDIMKEYVVGQARLGYATFVPGPVASDIILATFPKSGSTWMSYLLHQLRSRGDEDFSDIKDEVIDITPGHWDPKDNPFLVEQRYSPRTFKTHGRYFLCPKGGKYIYIARNPQDILWSLYHFIHDLFGIKEYIAIEDFYRHYFVDRFGTDHDIANVWDHLLSWYPHRMDKNFLWLHYEDLLENREVCLRKISEHIGIKLDSDLLQLVLQRSSIDYIRTLSTKMNPSQDNRAGKVTLTFGSQMRRYAKNMEFGKMRKGISGDGQNSLPQQILRDLDMEWKKRIMPVLGYECYDDMRERCSLI